MLKTKVTIHNLQPPGKINWAPKILFLGKDPVAKAEVCLWGTCRGKKRVKVFSHTAFYLVFLKTELQRESKALHNPEFKF